MTSRFRCEVCGKEVVFTGKDMVEIFAESEKAGWVKNADVCPGCEKAYRERCPQADARGKLNKLIATVSDEKLRVALFATVDEYVAEVHGDSQDVAWERDLVED